MEELANRQAYHHGDLRSALIETGLHLLKTKAHGDIGLREVARETGVSATAVYRHFPDKDALMRALALAGYEKLFDAQEAAAAAKSSREESFRATGQAYVHFAVANPALFGVMTKYMSDAPGEEARARAAQARPGVSLRENIASLLPDGASKRAQDVVAIQAMALVHGLAQLVLGGQIPNDPDLINAAVDQFGNWRRVQD
ncbi:TetR/AcrR family transcriptional regulator [Parasphingopyxis lamellibrachiae]|uniref:TetR family transcriptional regulator n=1 Tax=Parasphingopyxis lamellibrachiae TaxID=680125 RepID=A0A3D9FD85_9SPHN|nr:TetR/AcrR family transcriptional regulator [Parasphingopyxis lamellibrachiae]RED15785.1 TetR family transcriptional regulator [Parasphingopyxis lamellibrachiae]